ncbi:MAG: fibrobacter succinogenes major paralogous domain-containing protein [Fibrobacter sp.]|jgi:uncharacterized protein (TIGR02145 family)|nr:fibrobacter succinogenes major paralogous domain-containing protein [Fibrobacter sp.]
MNQGFFKLSGCILALLFLVAVPEAQKYKTWDYFFGKTGEGEYAGAKIKGQIRFFKYTRYPESQPVSFTVSDGLFEFAATGNMKVSPEAIESGFYASCNSEKEAWISYFNPPVRFGKQSLIIEIKGIDLACGNELFALRDLKIKFKNPEAQKLWVKKFETSERAKRKQLAEYRIDEQEKQARVRERSGEFKDPRDGQVYRTITVDNRTWFAQNLNYDVPGQSWCYEDKDSYCARGGRLYSLEGARSACPQGWHLPRDKEWQDMLKALTHCYDGVQNCGDFGAKLKARTGWQGGGGSDEYGFSVISSGRRDVAGSYARYVEIGDYAAFWSAQNGRAETIWIWVLGRMSDNMLRQLAQSKNHGYSVRCINGD